MASENNKYIIIRYIIKLLKTYRMRTKKCRNDNKYFLIGLLYEQSLHNFPFNFISKLSLIHLSKHSTYDDSDSLSSLTFLFFVVVFV